VATTNTAGATPKIFIGIEKIAHLQVYKSITEGGKVSDYHSTEWCEESVVFRRNCMAKAERILDQGYFRNNLILVELSKRVEMRR
jgi:hypothetical protein